MNARRSFLEPPVPTSGIMLAEVDGLRAVAAMNVLVCHSMLGSRWQPSWVSPMLDGGMGVALFFVISGFLLSLPFLRAHDRGERFDLGPYALRRMLRILPAYYVNLALSLLFLWPEGLTTARGLFTVLAHLTLAFGVSETMVNAISPVYWTLAVEEQFYLALPLIALLLVRRRGLPLLCLGLLVPNVAQFAFTSVWGRPGVALTTSLPYNATGFVLGMLVAVLFHRYGPIVNARSARSRKVRSVLPLLVPAGLALTYSARPCFVHEPVFLQMWALGWALVLLAVLMGPPWLGAPLRWKPVRALGLLTFSVYLWHIIVAERVVALSDPPESGLMALARIATVFLFTLPFAAGSYLLVERPFMDLRRRLERERKMAPPAVRVEAARAET